MARKLRLEEAGGMYHVLNRGNYRNAIFADEGAKRAFETTLFEACVRSRWRLHAFAIMRNHYHLALETPEPNLTDGVRWLQSTFANRFNRFRRESGHLFQGRFKSLIVENTERMSCLCHYLHLNPTRAGICPAAQLSQHRWTSLWHFFRPKERPAFLVPTTSLEGAGALSDNPDDWSKYLEYVEWLAADEPAKKTMAFEKMSRGWAIGSDGYQKIWLQDARTLRTHLKLTQEELRTARIVSWQERLTQCLAVVQKNAGDLACERKSAPWKIAVAAFLRRSLCPNSWIAVHLQMGSAGAVSRYVIEMKSGLRPAALSHYTHLCVKVTI